MKIKLYFNKKEMIVHCSRKEFPEMKKKFINGDSIRIGKSYYNLSLCECMEELQS